MFDIQREDACVCRCSRKGDAVPADHHAYLVGVFVLDRDREDVRVTVGVLVAARLLVGDFVSVRVVDGEPVFVFVWVTTGVLVRAPVPV